MVSKRPEPRTYEDFGRELGVNLQRRRVDLGFSQERVAYVAGMSPKTYQKYEKGESSPGRPMNPCLRNLMALCQALDLRLDDLMPADWPDLTKGR